MHAVLARRSTAAAATLLALLSAGCATMNRQECATSDWRTVGYEDGVNGYSGSHVADYRKACSKYGVTPDLTRYQEGRTEGLREYCRPSNGYRIGAGGGSYGGVCPTDLEGPFLSAFNSGHELYTLEARVWAVDAQLEARRRELSGMENGIVASSAAVVSGGTSGEQRVQALVDTAQMAERVGQLRVEIQQLEADRVNCARDLEEYRAAMHPVT